MKWYTAIGCKGEDGEGRLLVKTDNQEKVLTEMETMLWAALTWTICAENRIYSQMYRSKGAFYNLVYFIVKYPTAFIMSVFLRLADRQTVYVQLHIADFCFHDLSADFNSLS